MTKETDYDVLVYQKYKPKFKDILFLIKCLLTFKFKRFYQTLKYIINYIKND